MGVRKKIPTIGQIVRTARGTFTQKDFAERIGTNQSMLSKYETGAVVHVPNAVVETCIHIMNTAGIPAAPDADAIAERIRAGLAGDDNAEARLAISRLLDCIEKSAPGAGFRGGKGRARRAGDVASKAGR